MALKKKGRETTKRAISGILTGRLISSRFFKRYFFKTGLFLIICVGFIALRFDCITSMERIKNLNREIDVMRTYKQRERSRYMTLTRESTMQHMVDSLGLGLSVPEQYPYRVKN